MTDTQLVSRDEDTIVVGNLTRKQVGLIKRTVAQGYTDDELMLFLFAAERKGLDPLSREIHTFKDSKGRIQIITGIDGFRARADATGCYMPGREPTFEMGPDGKPICATAYIQRWDERSGSWIEVAASAWYDEQERSAPVWSKMPRVMLAKCAEAMAFRRAFPSQLGSIYIKEEFSETTPADAPMTPLADLSPEAEERLRNPTAPAPQATKPEIEIPDAEYTETSPAVETAVNPECPGDPPGKGRRTKCKGPCGGLYYGKNLEKGLCVYCRPLRDIPAADPLARAASAPPSEPTPPTKPGGPDAPKTAPRDRFVAVLQDGAREGTLDPNVVLPKVMEHFPGLAKSDHRGDYSLWTDDLADEAIELLHKYSEKK